jgi:hypothetical protein
LEIIFHQQKLDFENLALFSGSLDHRHEKLGTEPTRFRTDPFPFMALHINETIL